MSDRVQQAALYVVLCCLAVVLAVVGALLVPSVLVLLRSHPPRLPNSVPTAEPLAAAVAAGARRATLSYGVLVAVVGNYLLCAYGGRAARSLAGGALPALAWLLTAIYVGSGRPEGDVVLTNSLSGVGFLVLGTAAAALGIARSTPRRRSTVSSDAIAHSA